LKAGFFAPLRVYSPAMTGQTEQRAAYPWPFFAAIAATLFLFLGFQALFSTLPLYVIAIGGSPADNGLATWVFALAALLARPLAGMLSDRCGHKPVLVVGAILFGGGPLLYGLAHPVFPFVLPVSGGMGWLLGARAVHGVGMALFSTAYQAFIADLVPPERCGEGLGLANAASMVTMVVAPLFGEWLARGFGFGVLFLALGGVGGLGVLATLALPGRRSGRGGAAPQALPAWENLGRALREPGVRAGALGMALLGVPFGAFIVFLPLLGAARGLSGTGWVFAAYALAASLTQPAAGRIADRWGAGRTAWVGLALAGLAMAGLAAAGGQWALIGVAVLFGVGYGAARAGLDVCVQGGLESSLRASGAAIQYTAHDLLIGLGSWGLGWWAGVAGYGAMYGMVSGITLLGLAGGLTTGRFLYRRAPRRPA